MLTKQQKAERVKEGMDSLKNSSVLLFADFSGTSVEDMKKLRKSLREISANFKVIKKRLLRIIFDKSGVAFNPEQFDAQVGTVFSPRDVFETTGPLYRSFKENEKKGFKILGGYDFSASAFIDAETLKKIGGLPSREVLLGQLVGMLAAPIKMLLYVMQQKSKETVENNF